VGAPRLTQEPPDDPRPTVDVGQYCRDVERHLTRVNGGHLVRIVGPAFDLVRRWAEQGVPLSVVFRAVEAKAERHRAGTARRPLRIEFCEADVRAAYERWRRAIGLMRSDAAAGDAPDAAGASGGDDARPRSLSKHLERAAERLSRAAARVDLPDDLRERIDAAIAELAALREQARQVRGPAREPILARLAPLDAELMAAARATAPAALLDALGGEAERDLAPFRGRLPADGWRQAIDRTVDRLLRDRFGLPLIEL
jgi:hypothetical protein